MTRKHFEAAGKLYPCPNPRHQFSFGRVVGHWQLAKDAWSHMNGAGNLVTTWVGVSKTETPAGRVVVAVILWKLSILFGFKKKGWASA